MKDFGAFRLTPQSSVIEAYFDWETGMIGPYNLYPSYGYVEEYHQKKPVPNTKWLYYVMSQDSYLVAAIFINNTYVCCLDTSGVVYYYDIYNRKKILSNESGICTDYYDYIPIGYELTRYKCQSVYLRPAKLIYSFNRKAINVRGNWIPLFEEVGLLNKEDLSLYYKLILDGCDYVYLTSDKRPVWKTL